MNSRPSEDPKEHLEEMTEQTAEKMASARRDVARARETLHDQIMSEPPTAVDTGTAVETDDETDTSSASADSESA